MNAAWNRWLILLAAAIALVVLAAPKPELRLARSAPSGGGWIVPKLGAPIRNAPAIVNDLTKAKLWSGLLDAPPSLDDKLARWRIAGITGRKNERYVLVLSGEDRVTPLKAGDKFPDNTTIAEVRENGICVILDGKKRFLPIDGQAIPIAW